jgi:nicotinate-nucleotide--dimethylbenzimidazole phosphoribosyltransferase
MAAGLPAGGMGKDPLQDAIAAIGPVNEEARRAAHERWATLTKPEGSLGRLEELGEQLAAIRGTARPAIHHRAMVVFAADHGVTDEGVSAYPKAVTAAMVQNFLSGGSAIGVFASTVRAALHIVDVGVDSPPLPPRPGLFPRKVARGTRNFAHERAMTPSQAREATRVGLDVALSLITAGSDLIGVGDMGIGNTTSASAVVAALTGAPAEKVVGKGIGPTAALVPKKSLVVASALERHSPNREDPWDVMESVGGFEIAAMGGAYLACASRRVPVIVDGFVGSAAALFARSLAPSVLPYLIPSHVSGEPGHRIALDALGLRPYLDLDFRLGEGTGAALQMELCDLASSLLRDMATFDEAAEARRSEFRKGASADRGPARTDSRLPTPPPAP